jgi:hypothetical protein
MMFKNMKFNQIYTKRMEKQKNSLKNTSKAWIFIKKRNIGCLGETLSVKFGIYMHQTTIFRGGGGGGGIRYNRYKL